MRIAVLANWGLGLSLLQCLGEIPDVEIAFVVTRYDLNDSDPWRNVVYEFAADKGYEVHQEQCVSFDLLRDLIVNRGADLLITHAYMKILPSRVFSALPLGSVNIHASLLPRHRGVSPTFWVLKNRETKTGLTSHYIDSGVDTGPIVAQVEVEVLPEDTPTTIIDRQKSVLGDLVRRTLENITDTLFKPAPQSEEAVTYAPRPSS